MSGTGMGGGPEVNDKRVVRVAAVGDVHSPEKPRAEMIEAFAEVGDEADLLLLCGDLTRRGKVEQARTLIEELSGVSVPAFAVLGNHDFHNGRQDTIADVLRDGGVTMLDGESASATVGGTSVSVAGTKGFCGGFGIRALPDFGEPIMREMYALMMEEGVKLERALRLATGEVKIAMTHYSPIAGTLQGEDQQIWPFLGSSRLAEAIDAGGAAVAFHGHSHYGVRRGTTSGGVPVHNVSMPTLKEPCALFEVGG